MWNRAPSTILQSRLLQTKPRFCIHLMKREFSHLQRFSRTTMQKLCQPQYTSHKNTLSQLHMTNLGASMTFPPALACNRYLNSIGILVVRIASKFASKTNVVRPSGLKQVLLEIFPLFYLHKDLQQRVCSTQGLKKCNGSKIARINKILSLEIWSPREVMA